MRRSVSVHLIAAAILALTVAALPAHLRATGTEWLRGQAWLSLCAPSAIIAPAIPPANPAVLP